MKGLLDAMALAVLCISQKRCSHAEHQNISILVEINQAAEDLASSFESGEYGKIDRVEPAWP